MTAKRITSDRKRSRPVEKRSKIPELKRGKLWIGIILIVIAIVAIAAIYVYIRSEDSGNPIAVIDTSMGTIKVELYEDKLPITAGNFIDHANAGYYDGLIFHRVISGFMIQGGDPKGDGTGGHAAEYHEGFGDRVDPETWVIPDEFHENLSNVRGAISMANRGPNTGGSQWFINVVDNTYLDYDKEPLDYKHAVFGIVIEGMDVVDAISEVETSNDKPLEDVLINSITIENQ